MAGAMRLGELTHLMESRLLHGDSPPVAATPDLFEALDTDLDHIAFVLDALREGRTNVELPEFAPLPARVEPSAPVAAVAASSIDAIPVAARSRRWNRSRRFPRKRPPRPSTSKPRRTRCSACAPTSSTGW